VLKQILATQNFSSNVARMAYPRHLLSLKITLPQMTMQPVEKSVLYFGSFGAFFARWA
jgi:hypothetical protein